MNMFWEFLNFEIHVRRFFGTEIGTNGVAKGRHGLRFGQIEAEYIN